MNKFAKALLLSLVFAAPVAISVPAVQASPVTAHQQLAHSSTQKAMRKHNRTHRKRGASLTRGTNPAATKAVGVHK